MKFKNIILAGLSLTMLAGATSCEDKLDVVNANQQTTADFGNTSSDLEEAVIACYNHIRMDGTFSRLGYLEEVCGGGDCCGLPARSGCGYGSHSCGQRLRRKCMGQQWHGLVEHPGGSGEDR